MYWLIFASIYELSCTCNVKSIVSPVIHVTFHLTYIPLGISNEREEYHHPFDSVIVCDTPLVQVVLSGDVCIEIVTFVGAFQVPYVIQRHANHNQDTC
jgi:hypothetical protein